MSDPNYNSVSLLLHFDGANDSTSFVDNSPTPKTVTAYGNARISTDQSRFGNSSMLSPGGSSHISAANSTDFDFGTQPFTIEMHVRVTTFSNYPTLVSRRISPIYEPYELYLDESGNPRLVLESLAKNNWAVIGIFSGIQLSLNTWHHIALTGDGSVLRCFRDGVLSYTTYTYSGVATGSTPLYIGRGGEGSLVGNIDDLRITKGIARYTANFTPPAAAFPNGVPQPPVIAYASAVSPLGSPKVTSGFGWLAKISANGPLSQPYAIAQIVAAARAASVGPLGQPSVLVQQTPQAQALASSMLGVPSVLTRITVYGMAYTPGPLSPPQAKAWHDFTGQIGDTVTRYLMDLITPSGTVRVPISSWQATLRTGASSYVQCVIPAAQQWGVAINAATSFRIYRRAVTASGQVIEYMMAEAPADTPQFDRGPTNHTCTLSGYAPGFAAQDVSPGADRTLTGIRSISSGASYRVRCAVDWLLRPGQRGVVDGVPFVVAWINYYVNTTDAYMEAGT